MTLRHEQDPHSTLIIDSVRDYAIFLLDTEGRVETWNTGARLIKGWTADEIVGQHIGRFYLPQDLAAGLPQRLLALAATEGRVEDEGWRIRKDGTRFWADVVITRRSAPDGTFIGYLKVTRDLTARKAAEDALRAAAERNRAMIESVKDYAIFMLDPSGHVATWNAGAERIKGYTAAEIIGQHFSVFYPPSERAAGLPSRSLSLAERLGRTDDEGWRLRKDGSRFWAVVVVTAVRDSKGVLLGFTKVTRDETERRRMEGEVRLRQSETVEAQKAVREREEFISVAAHELRTPLTALQLKLEGLENVVQKGAELNVDKLADRVRGAIKQTERMTYLVERLLDLTRIVAGKLLMQPEPLDLAALANEIVEELAPAARLSGSEIRIATRGPVAGRWDRTRLEQVITNLVGNAIKYGEGKPIDVQVEPTEGGARLVVCDRGIGISAEDVDRIFDRFERAVPLQHYGGLGLGLYITRYIVEAHGGSVTVESRPGGGSTFVVELPFAGTVSAPELREPPGAAR